MNVVGTQIVHGIWSFLAFVALSKGVLFERFYISNLCCFLFQIEKRNGWLNVGDLRGCIHFKIIRYEKIKFLVVGLENSIEIYAWAPKPYHKFMAFKVKFELSVFYFVE